MSFKFSSEFDYGQYPVVKFIAVSATQSVIAGGGPTLIQFVPSNTNSWVKHDGEVIIFKKSGQYFVRFFVGGEVAETPYSTLTLIVSKNLELVNTIKEVFPFNLGTGDPKLRFLEISYADYMKEGDTLEISVIAGSKDFNVENRDTNLTYVEILFCSP